MIVNNFINKTYQYNKQQKIFISKLFISNGYSYLEQLKVNIYFNHFIFKKIF